MKKSLSVKMKGVLAQTFWKIFHPKTVKREGFIFKVDPYVVPWYVKTRMGGNVLPIFDKYIKKGDIVLDIGASFGFYSLYASKKAKKVIAFEPIKRAYKLLLENVKNNSIKNVTAHNCALGDTKKKAKLYLNRHCSGASSMVEKSSYYELVDIVPVDSIFSRADFVKMDVEGMEYQVLLGMRKLLSKSKPIIFLEISRDEKVIKKLLNSYGYEVSHARGGNFIALPKKRKRK